jgi:hypothetical protein
MSNFDEQIKKAQEDGNILYNALPPGKILRGKFFYSYKQFAWLRKKKDRGAGPERIEAHPRTFCQLDDGQILEYTEMIFETILAENLATLALCEEDSRFDDYKVLGFGYFHHFGEIV